MAKNRLLKTASVLLAFLVLLPGNLMLKAAADSPAVYTVAVSGTDLQTVKGWGLFPAWNRTDWSEQFTDKTGAQQALLRDLGVNMFRVMLPYNCGDENGNLAGANMQQVLAMVNTCESYGSKDYVMSVWSPPVGMKTVATVDGWTGSEHVRLRTDKEDAYCTYLANAINYLKSNGAPAPKALSFQNEPLAQIQSEWCYWGGDNGAQYQRVAKLLRTKLDGAGLSDVEIIGPEGGSYHENEMLLGTGFSAMQSDPALAAAIGGIDSHSYISQGYDTTGILQQYAAAAANFPGKDRWMTEYCENVSSTTDNAEVIDAARRLSSDMVLIGNNYWFWWLGWSQSRDPFSGGEVLLDGDGYTVTKTQTYYLLSKIFQNAPAGSKVRRVTADPASGLTTADSMYMDGSAFVSGGKTVVLLTNPTQSAKSIRVTGLSGVSADVYQTTPSAVYNQDLTLAARRNVIGGTASAIDLPASSVTVIVTSDTDTAGPHITFDQQASSSGQNAGYAVRSADFTISGQLDEAGTLQINGSAVSVDPQTFRFQKALTLSPGDNTITAVATDTHGNTGSPQTLYIRYDPAYFGMTLDQAGTRYVNTAAFTVSGALNAAASVTVTQSSGGIQIDQKNAAANSNPVTGLAAFSTSLTLHQGDNSIAVTAAASDGSGAQTGPVTIHAVYDAAPPVITAPDTDTVSGSAYVLRGSVNEDSAVTVNGAAVTLSPDRSFTTIVPVVSGDNTITVAATDLAGNTATKTVSVSCTGIADGAMAPGIAEANRLQGGITVDGNLNESGWNLNKFVTKNITGTSDNSVSFDTAWDDTNLYVAVRVLDADLKNDSADAYNDDSVEIYLDGDNSRGASYDGNDHQITLGWHDGTLSVGGNITGIQSAQADIAGGYTAEFSIPWSGIGVSAPEVGGVMGFDVGCNDDDGHSGGGRDAQLMWNGTGDNWQSPANFGLLYFGDGRRSAAAVKPGSAVTIDGALNESDWKLTNTVSKIITGSPDNIVRFGTLCDGQSLYIGAEVLDANLKNDSDAAYQDDSIEFYIDADNCKGASYDAYDHQITLGWHDSALAVGGDITGIQFAQQDIPGGYTVEIAIPWTGLGITPTRDETIGFDVGVNDDDGNSAGSRDGQLMWNGGGDNWQNASAFGNLLLHNADFPAKTQPDSPPTNLSSFTDTCADLSKLYAHTSSIITANYDTGKYANDADRLTHSDGTTGQSVTYQSPGGDIASFDIKTVLFSGTAPFTFYTSADGVNFTPLTVTSTPIWSGSGFGETNNHAEGLPAGTRYLKIVFPDADNWTNQLAQVDFAYAATLGAFTDTCADLSGLYAQTAGIIAVNYDVGTYANDAGRLTHSDGTTGQSVTYASPGGALSSFDVKSVLFMGTAPFTFYGSADGVTFTPLTVTSGTVWSGGAYTEYNYHGEGLPAGTRYLKIVFPDADNWTNQLAQVDFRYAVNEEHFTDTCADLSSLYAHTAGIIAVNYDVGTYANDAGRLTHSDGTTGQSVTYASPGGALSSFDVKSVLFMGTAPFTFYTSADGVTFTPLTVTSGTVWSGGAYTEYNYHGEGLPAGTRYLKIIFPDADNWTNQLAQVDFRYAVNEEHFTDTCDDLSGLYAHTAGIIAVNYDVGTYANDAGRLTHSDGTTGQSVTYASPGGALSSFDVKSVLFMGTAPFTFYTSADGVTFTPLTVTSGTVWSGGAYTEYNYHGEGLPAGTRYLKIVFPDADNWTNQLAQVDFRYLAPVLAAAISLDHQTAAVVKGGTFRLTATVLPADASDKSVTWSSGNTGVATVANDGTVTGVGAGTAIITAATAGGAFSAACTVTVTVPVQSIALSSSTLSVAKGSESRLTATVLPADASDKSVTWSSGNTGVATVANDGTVTGVGAGTAIISAATAGGAFSAACTVTVTVPVQSVAFDPAHLALSKGSTAKLSITIQPADASNCAVNWSSSNTGVATVANDGTVTAVGEGTVTVTVTTADGSFTCSCVVTVTKAVVAPVITQSGGGQTAELDSQAVALLDDDDSVAFSLGDVAFSLPAGVLKGLSGDDVAGLQLSIGDAAPDALGNIRLLAGGSGNVLASFQLELQAALADGSAQAVHELGGAVLVSVRVPDDALAQAGSPQNLRLYYYDEQNDTLVDMNGVFDPATKTMTFETDHFSTYVIGLSASAAAPAGSPSGTEPQPAGENPKTGGGRLPVLPALPVAAAALLFVLGRRRKRA